MTCNKVKNNLFPQFRRAKMKETLTLNNNGHIFYTQKVKNKIFIPSEMCFCGNLFINNKFLFEKRDFSPTQVSPKR